MDAVAEAILYVDVDTTLGYEVFRDTVDIGGKFRAREAETFLPAPLWIPGAQLSRRFSRWQAFLSYTDDASFRARRSLGDAETRSIHRFSHPIRFPRA